MPDTVLSHLALRFAEHPENLATEALGFILGRSHEARTALAALARQIGFDCPNDLVYQAQVSGDSGARPDLVGTGSDGLVRVVLEAKFWAGLTEAQPVTYLASLRVTGGLLLFIAPAQRLDTLWTELLRRTTEAGHSGAPSVTPAPEQRQLRINDLILAVISWRALLDVIGGALERAGDAVRAADVR